MNEEVSNRRVLLVGGVIGAVIILILVVCGVTATRNVGKTPDAVTTTTTLGTTTTSSALSAVDDAFGTMATTAPTSTNNSTTAREDRYDFPEATTTQPLFYENSYQVDIEFDGWQLYIDKAIYNEAARTLSFDFRQICTRKNAQPIYYELSQFVKYEQPRALTYSEQELPTPSLPRLYYSLDHLQAREFRVTVEDVDPEFGILYIDLETMSVPDDDTAVYGGTIVTKTLLLQQQQIPRV